MRRSYSGSSYRFYNMGAKPLAYDVCCGKRIAIPAGTTNVRIAFRQSHLTRLDDNGNTVPMNVYLWNGKMYHA